MSTRKERLTVTVDPDLVRAGNDAVSEGRAESLSAWSGQVVDHSLLRQDFKLGSSRAALAARAGLKARVARRAKRGHCRH